MLSETEPRNGHTTPTTQQSLASISSDGSRFIRSLASEIKRSTSVQPHQLHRQISEAAHLPSSGHKQPITTSRIEMSPKILHQHQPQPNTLAQSTNQHHLMHQNTADHMLAPPTSPWVTNRVIFLPLPSNRLPYPEEAVDVFANGISQSDIAHYNAALSRHAMSLLASLSNFSLPTKNSRKRPCRKPDMPLYEFVTEYVEMEEYVAANQRPQLHDSESANIFIKFCYKISKIYLPVHI